MTPGFYEILIAVAGAAATWAAQKFKVVPLPKIDPTPAPVPTPVPTPVPVPAPAPLNAPAAFLTWLTAVRTGTTTASEAEQQMVALIRTLLAEAPK